MYISRNYHRPFTQKKQLHTVVAAGLCIWLKYFGYFWHPVIGELWMDTMNKFDQPSSLQGKAHNPSTRAWWCFDSECEQRGVDVHRRSVFTVGERGSKGEIFPILNSKIFEWMWDTDIDRGWCRSLGWLINFNPTHPSKVYGCEMLH